MTRLSPLVLLALLVPPVAVSRAQEPDESELEFVQKLRGKGYVELAKTYIDQMQKRGDPKIAAVIPLEEARTLVALAKEKDVEQRLALYTAAQKQLHDYAGRHQGTLEGAHALLELARVSTLEGQALLTIALREEDSKVAHDRARPAEAKFKQAGDELEAALKALTPLASADKKLEDELTQVKLDQGANILEQARTYIDLAQDEVNKNRAITVSKAKKIFEEIGKKSPPGVQAMAYAWLMKVSMESQDPQKTQEYFQRVMIIAGEEPSAIPAKRWARLFAMQNVLTDPRNANKTVAAKLKSIELEGKAWIKDYPNALRSPEGQGVLWELAGSLRAQADQFKEKERTSKPAVELYTESAKYYSMLGQMDGDLSQKATQLSMAISFQLSGNKTDLRTFDEYYEKGMNELIKLNQAGVKLREVSTKLEEGAPKDRDALVKQQTDLEKERKQHIKGMVDALRMAVNLATGRTPVAKLDDARYYLAWAYIVEGDLPRAAVAAESLGRVRPPTRRSPAGAATAIDSYANLLAKDNDAGTRDRLEDLARYVLAPEQVKAWAGDPALDIAHYQLGMLYRNDNRFKDAVAELQQIQPTFPAYIYAQGQLVFIAQQGRRASKDPAEQKVFQQAAKEALKRLPPLPEKADRSTVAMYFLAEMELAKFLYAEATEELRNTTDPKSTERAANGYREMARMLQELQNRYQKLSVKLSGENDERIRDTLDTLLKYADLGQADLEFRKGTPEGYTAVIKTAEKVVDRVLSDAKNIKGEEPLRYKDYEVTGDVLGVALRAYIQKGDVEKGKALLSALQRLRPTEGVASVDRTNVTRRVLEDIASQIKQLKDSKDPKKQESLKATVGNFTAFLDLIGQESAKKGLDLPGMQMLAFAYSSLGEHHKAAGIFAKVPPPKCIENPKLTPEEEKEVGNYWAVRLQYGKALRHSKQEEDLKKASTVFDEMIKHKNGRYQMLADMEKNMVLEDEKAYGAAAVQWGKFLKNPNLVSKVPTDKEVQRIFFTAAWNRARCMYKYGHDDPKVKDREKFIKKAIEQVVHIEFAPDQIGWGVIGPMVGEFAQADPDFRQEYDRQRAAAQQKNKGAASAPGAPQVQR